MTGDQPDEILASSNYHTRKVLTQFISKNHSARCIQVDGFWFECIFVKVLKLANGTWMCCHPIRCTYLCISQKRWGLVPKTRILNNDELLTKLIQILALQTFFFSLVLHHSPPPLITTPREMSTRSILVDDNSPLISYQGPWVGGDTYSVNSFLGEPFNNTLHALSASGSFTFNFTGK